MSLSLTACKSLSVIDGRLAGHSPRQVFTSKNTPLAVSFTSSPSVFGALRASKTNLQWASSKSCLLWASTRRQEGVKKLAVMMDASEDVVEEVVEEVEEDEESGFDDNIEENDFVEPPEEAKLYVGNLPFNIDAQMLGELFEGTGEVMDVNVIKDRVTGNSRGFAFVSMSTVEEADKCIEKFNQYSFEGRILTVRKAIPSSGMADSLHSSLLETNEQDEENISRDGGEVLVPKKTEVDIPTISTCEQFRRESWIESKKLWAIAGPAIFTTLCNYSIGGLTQVFTGHLGTVELAAMAIENSVIALLGMGTMYGMASALETLCGQAFGAGQIHMLGVYMQRSWIILLSTGLIMSLVYFFATPILKALGQDDDVADLAGVFALWMLPQLVAFALYFPMQKFLQSQRKLMAMTWIAFVALIINVFLSWLLIFKLGLGLVGAAISLNLAWWIIVIGQFSYIILVCQDAWTGFSWLAFQDLWAFVRLSLASAVMLCLEIWYFMSLIVMTGNLKNATIELDAISICMNLNGWEAMVFIGFNAAISVRVSNELGAGRPRAAKFSVVIVVLTSLSIGLLCMGIVLATKNDFAVLFTNSKVVMETVSNMANLLGVTMLLNSVQPVLSGVAVGGGWQALIAYVNVGCYYIVGVPLGLLMGYKFDLGGKGIWSGMICGTALQTSILLLITYFTNWNREAAQAEGRLKIWGGSIESHTNGSKKEEENVENQNIP